MHVSSKHPCLRTSFLTECDEVALTPDVNLYTIHIVRVSVWSLSLEILTLTL